MPVFNPKGGQGKGEGEGSEPGAQRTSFRPPWVKEGPSPLPMPTAPWIRRQDSNPPQPSQIKEKPFLKALNQVNLRPVKQISAENGRPNKNDEVVKKETGKAPPVRQETKERVVSIKVEPEPAKEPPKTSPRDRLKKVKMPEKEEVQKVIAPPPPLPPPPPPTGLPSGLPPVPKKPMTGTKAEKLEALKSRPRRRPDWVDMMKEVETGIKLKHVHCNDRSAPVIPKAKAKGQFVYESEQENVHNQLLKQIQRGVNLKRVKCNDRSKPMLEGLRKFRRQMTIEEQIQKSASVADVVAVAAEPDELDDIDKVRDDLQSTKQMLALELRNKEALERENKRLMARLLNLEIELEKANSSPPIQTEKGNVQMRTAEDDKLIKQLKEEAQESVKMSKEMEDMYHKTAEELDVTRAKLESAWLKNAQLEMELKALETRGEIPITRQPSKKLIPSQSMTKPPESSEEEYEEEEETETETESEEDDAAKNAAQQEKRILRELKLLTSKLRNLKEKRSMSLKEKSNLKDHFYKLHKNLREERRKYKALQREVDKMAKLMKDVDEEDGENEEQDEPEEVYEEESESESESEESEGEDSEGDLPDSASNQDKINNLNKRIRMYETRLTTLKKSNYLLKANIDRRQDDLNRQKEMSLTLQEDLNSVLAELG